MSLPKIFEMENWRAMFAARFADFLQDNYKNPEHVAHVFDVRYQTALNWWQGVNRPSGDVVARAAISNPNEFFQHFGGPAE